ALCVSKGGYLVNIGSSGEQAYIEILIYNTAKKKFWIGGNDIGQNQQYWTKGNAVGTKYSPWYTNWNHGQPSRTYKGKREACMLIKGSEGDRWTDGMCHSHYSYICEHDNAS
ncbi:unnamed protein product, partial [Owenia fusiformis]